MSLGHIRVHFGPNTSRRGRPEIHLSHILIQVLISEISNEGKTVKINYFEDTDTAFIEFTSQPVAETRELCKNIYIDLDEQRNLVSMKIEHAEQSANILEFTFERQEKAPT